MDASDLVGAAFLPTDGQANPSDITQALAKGARQQGVRIIEDCPVTGVRIEDGRVTGVATAARRDRLRGRGVNCAGQWAGDRPARRRQRAAAVRCSTSTWSPSRSPGVPRNLPTLRDPDRLIYFKEEVGGLVMGGYEPNPIPWAERRHPGRLRTSRCSIPTGTISSR